MAGELSRRSVLGSALGAIVARFLPAIPAAPVAAAPTKALLPAWIVGTPGEPDHEVIRALTREDAIRRPLGVTPDSAVEFYDARMADEAEARRTGEVRL